MIGVPPTQLLLRSSLDGFFEAINPKKLVLLVREAEVADARLAAAAAGPGIDDGVADAAILQPAGLAAVQQLDFPGSIELAHLGHSRPVVLAGLHRLGVAQLAVRLQEVDFTLGGDTHIKRGLSGLGTQLQHPASATAPAPVGGMGQGWG